MALRAKRPCRKPGCPELVDTGYCDDHKQHERDADRWRGTPAERGYDSAWRRIRVQALTRDKYLCQDCLTVGRVTSAQDVDHVQPIASAPHLRLDLSNLRSLCRPCHMAKHAKTER
jgi:5-methylcytosine-specific restriction protein A